MYLDALGRPGSVAELDSWVAILHNPKLGGANAVTFGIEKSDEAYAHIVESWYVDFLGRPTFGAAQIWVNQLRSGKTEEEVLSQILGSPEFYARAQTYSGAADDRYVKALYPALLHRTPGVDEVDGWVRRMQSVGAAGVALGLLQGAEYRTILFSNYYRDLLHREPDRDGLMNWVNSGKDAAAVRLAIETSAEFQANG